MSSHTVTFTRRDLARITGAPLITLVALAALIHLGALTHLLPAPRPTLDMDRTILVHQVGASRTRHDAEILLVGDSSCLMDVDAPGLTQALGKPVLNLGTISYLDLPSSGRLTQQYAQMNPDRLRTVVLLMHPDSLRLQAPSAYHLAQFGSLLAGREAPAFGGFGARVQGWLGVDILAGRLLSRWVPSPLPGDYGRFYGFTTDLARWLTMHRGSAVDPGRFDRARAQGNAEYRLAKRFESESQQWRALVPAGVRVVVGLTPAPASFVGPGHAAICRRLLTQWAEWLRADAMLLSLPATLPDDQFASVTHLNATGQERFTQQLAEALRESGRR